jgi:ABC-type polysaccharide/polyol phosphate transport system ATPase subunit
VLDEALGGSDQAFREKVQRRLGERVARGAALILTSHNPTTIERHCRRVIVLDRGQAVHDGTPADGLALLATLRRAAPDTRGRVTVG